MMEMSCVSRSSSRTTSRTCSRTSSTKKLANFRYWIMSDCVCLMRNRTSLLTGSDRAFSDSRFGPCDPVSFRRGLLLYPVDTSEVAESNKRIKLSCDYTTIAKRLPKAVLRLLIQLTSASRFSFRSLKAEVDEIDRRSLK
jgi:hypothetical protein